MLKEMPFRVTLLKVPRKRVLRILSKEEVHLLIETAKHPYRGILLVAANTGFRIDEILHLTWNDIFWDEDRIAVTGKAGWTLKSYQERSCYVSHEVMDYLREHRNRSQWVFVNRRGKPLKVEPACNRIRAVFQRCGLYRRGISTHLIRHSVCSHLLGNKVDLETVRVIMGHASIQTTQGYAHTTDDRMKKAVQALPW
ncbi:MAG TPA: tyrosine-type recombinase/integrase [Myxococcota bacterium]|nr:tyrosine-type recombinase/integrase [Myxococcota bacterium]